MPGLPSEKTSMPDQLQAAGKAPKRLGMVRLVGQCCSIGPLIDIALFLGIVASLAGAIGPLAVALAGAGMVLFSLVVAFFASETGGAGAIGDYIGRVWGRRSVLARWVFM